MHDPVRAAVGADLVDLLQPAFSTTTVEDWSASLVALMDTVSPYYEFTWVSSCGIPKIRLEGTAQDWREWVAYPQRPGLWLGHSPEPWIEYQDTAIRVHQQGGFVCEPSPDGCVEIALADMPGLLLGVQQRLEGFLGAVQKWVARISPALADPIVDSLDRHLDVRRPLSLE